MSLKPLKLKNLLANSPEGAPQYSVTVKSKSNEDVVCGDPKMTRALLALMDLGAVNGGAACHWGGPAAMAESMSAVHAIMFKESKWFDHYNFVNDIGHAENGIYALRANLGFDDLTFNSLKGFRSIESKLTGHGESHIYPEGVLLSNGPLSSSLPQAQGLAHADKLLGNKRTTIVSMSDGASMEGEAKESFAAIPGLSVKGNLNPFVLIISDNNTKLSGRIDDDSFDMTPTFASMEGLGWNVVKIEQGNDLEKCYQGIETAIESAQSGKPVFVWLKTVKGFGVKSTEDSASGGHGFPVKGYSEDIHNFLDEIMGGNTPAELTTWAKELTVAPAKGAGSSVPAEKAQAGLARGANKAVAEGFPVYSVSCDLAGSTGMKNFQTTNKENFIDIGIAESNMVSHAIGLSRAGIIPIVDTFAAFGVTKGNLPLIMASLSSCPMIAVFSHTGFQDAADGASHQSLTYLSAISSIPNTKAIIVSTSKEAEELMYEAITTIAKNREAGKSACSYIFFVGRENFPKELESVKSYSVDKAQIITEGDDGVIVSAGPSLFKALKVAETLKTEGKSITVINSPCVNTPDVQTISAALKKSGKLITVEDHQIIGGLGSQLVHALKMNGDEFSVQSLGVKGNFGQSAYMADELYAKNGMDETAIISAFNSL
jgi:transketolase